MPTDWQDLNLATAPAAVVDPRQRLRGCVGAFAVLLAVVWCRAAQMEVSQGAAFRAEAVRPVRREKPLPAPRGRILARDGTVLACDRQVAGIAVDYRWLENPPRQAWLEQTARTRLPKDQRRNARRLAEEVEKLRRERGDLHRRLAALCSVDPAEWQARAHRVQEHVERVADNARQRQLESTRAPSIPRSDATWSDRLSAALHDIFAPARDATPANVTVAEELSEHVLAEDVSAVVVAEIQAHADRYPGTRIVQLTRRAYPQGTLAAHVLGYLGQDRGVGQDCAAIAGPPNLDDPLSGGPALTSSLVPPYEIHKVGVTGIERQCEEQLRGTPGIAVETLDHAGRIESTSLRRAATPGMDVVLTIDVHLQQTAEELLDSAVRRADMQYPSRKPSGGAIVVLDVRNGEILALASAPRFDPAALADSDSSRREALLADPAAPLFHRAIQMALPPGSVFKTLTAVALLESAGLDPQATFHCRGYLDRPDQQRCETFVRHGTGHGDVTLADALAQSCNVYFFHHAESLPPEALFDWSGRFGFGQPTGIDLPGEAGGIVPSPDGAQTAPGPVSHRASSGHRRGTAGVQAMAVGQGALTATPLQVVRMMAAIANGGLLVTPRVARGDCPDFRRTFSQPVRNPPDGENGTVPLADGRPIPGLTYSSLAAVRAGLLHAVKDEEGTAHDTLDLAQVSIAGKTGTAAIGDEQPDHAWFAGYLPADKPRYAMVVVLERAGDASTAACPVAKRLILNMLEMGLFSASKAAAVE